MPVAKGKGTLTAATMVVVACFCVFSLVQFAPLHSRCWSSAAAFANLAHSLTRHAQQQVSPRRAEVPLADAVGWTHVGLATQGGVSRMAMCVFPWPLGNWRVHQRISPVSADNPEPA
jgi:hypothetical protein